MKKDTYVTYFLFAGILMSFLFGFILFFQTVIDDGFIFFKYGYNLVHHGVWSWSVNGKPIEAYTSFVYAVFSIFPYLLNVPPHIFIKLVGLVILCWMLFRIYQQASNKKIALFALLIVVTNWQVYVHTFSGLETVLWCYLLLESFFIIHKESIENKEQWLLWFLCFVLALTRPEAVIYSAFYLIYLVFYRKIKLNFLPIVVVGIIGLIYFIARYKYFGLLFPLPFYHKVMDNQFGFLAFFFNLYTSWHYIICSFLLLFLFRKYKPVFYVGLVSFLIFFGLYGKSFLVMNFADRFPFQLYVPFVLFALLSIERFPTIDKYKVMLVAGFLNLIVFSKGIYNENFIELASITNNAGSAFFVPRSHYLLAKNINKIPNVAQKDIHVLFGDAGVFPHYVKATCHDYNGLTDPYFAEHPLTKSYFDSAHADIVLIGSAKEDKDLLAKDLSNCKLVYNMVDKNPDFEYLGFTTCRENGYYVQVYIHKTSPHYEELKTALNNGIKESANAVFSIKRFLKFKYLNMDNV